tara:strand:- start:742 stop:1458 length:717 start_codon:yes stop_codon:yes gene_type:complete
MKSLSKKDYPKVKPKIRRYSVLPARAVQDESLHPTSLHVLAALGLHTNAMGVCWPSTLTIALHIGKSRVTVSRHVQRLIKAGYIRKLDPKAYPSHVVQKGRRKTNRYQVLWDGKDPIPTKEEFFAPRAKVAEYDWYIDHGEVKIDSPDTDKRRGSGGSGSTEYQTLAQAFKNAVERTTGSTRLVEPSYQAAKLLIDQGVSVDQVRESTAAMCVDGLKKGRMPPLTLDQVAKWSGLYKK